MESFSRGQESPSHRRAATCVYCETSVETRLQSGVHEFAPTGSACGQTETRLAGQSHLPIPIVNAGALIGMRAGALAGNVASEEVASLFHTRSAARTRVVFGYHTSRDSKGSLKHRCSRYNQAQLRFALPEKRNCEGESQCGMRGIGTQIENAATDVDFGQHRCERRNPERTLVALRGCFAARLILA